MFFFGAKNLWCHRWFWKLPGWMGEKDLWDIGILKFQETILVFRWEEILKCWIPKDERRLCLSVLVWDRSADKSGSVSSPPIPPDCPNCQAREEEIEGTRGPHIIFIRHEESWPSKWKEVYPVYIPDYQTLYVIFEVSAPLDIEDQTNFQLRKLPPTPPISKDSCLFNYFPDSRNQVVWKFGQGTYGAAWWVGRG